MNERNLASCTSKQLILHLTLDVFVLHQGNILCLREVLKASILWLKFTMKCICASLL